MTYFSHRCSIYRWTRIWFFSVLNLLIKPWWRAKRPMMPQNKESRFCLLFARFFIVCLNQQNICIRISALPLFTLSVLNHPYPISFPHLLCTASSLYLFCPSLCLYYPASFLYHLYPFLLFFALPLFFLFIFSAASRGVGQGVSGASMDAPGIGL